jgi:hypothetical protein
VIYKVNSTLRTMIYYKYVDLQQKFFYLRTAHPRPDQQASISKHCCWSSFILTVLPNRLGTKNAVITRGRYFVSIHRKRNLLFTTLVRAYSLTI